MEDENTFDTTNKTSHVFLSHYNIALLVATSIIVTFANLAIAASARMATEAMGIGDAWIASAAGVSWTCSKASKMKKKVTCVPIASCQKMTWMDEYSNYFLVPHATVSSIAAVLVKTLTPRNILMIALLLHSNTKPNRRKSEVHVKHKNSSREEIYLDGPVIIGRSIAIETIEASFKCRLA